MFPMSERLGKAFWNTGSTGDRGTGVYFGRDGAALVVLLMGGTKQRQQRDIAAARRFWTDYKQRRAREGGMRRLWH